MTIGRALRSLVSWWPKLPKALRVVVGCVIIGCSLLLTWLAWSDGYIQRWLPPPPIGFDQEALTKDLQNEFAVQTDTMKAVSADGTHEIKVYLKDTMAIIRKNAEDSLLRPMARLFTSIDGRLRALEQNQAALSDQMDDIPRPDNEALYEVVDAIRGQPTNAELLKLLRAQSDSLQNLKKDLARKKGSPIKL